jgi:hypothetical protein
LLSAGRDVAMGAGKRSRVPLDLRKLSAREDIFRLSGASRHDAAVETWLKGEPVELRAIAKKWFTLMRECGDDVLELVHDGCPVACVGDAAFGYVNSFKNHVNVGFFFGAALHDPERILAGSGKRMRHVKMPADQPISASLTRLIAAAYADIKNRLDADLPP